MAELFLGMLFWQDELESEAGSQGSDRRLLKVMKPELGWLMLERRGKDGQEVRC